MLKYLIVVWNLARWEIYSYAENRRQAQTAYDCARGVFERVQLLKTETLEGCKPPCRKPNGIRSTLRTTVG